MKFAFIAAKAAVQAIVMLSFMVVIFATVGFPENRPANGFVDFLLWSEPSRFAAAFVITGVFGWLFCLDGKQFWLRAIGGKND